MFTNGQSRRALHYSIKWLEHEIAGLKAALKTCQDSTTEHLLSGRLNELERDYAEFSALNN